VQSEKEFEPDAKDEVTANDSEKKRTSKDVDLIRIGGRGGSCCKVF